MALLAPPLFGRSTPHSVPFAHTHFFVRDMAADALLGTCLGALDLLLELSENCPDLMSPYANTVGDLVLGGGGMQCMSTLHSIVHPQKCKNVSGVIQHTEIFFAVAAAVAVGWLFVHVLPMLGCT